MNSVLPVMEWAYLTDTDAWFMGKLKNGLMATDRQDVMLDFWQDETNFDFFASIRCRFGGVVTQYKYWIANSL
jgi:hypothetical protein